MDWPPGFYNCQRSSWTCHTPNRFEPSFISLRPRLHPPAASKFHFDISGDNRTFKFPFYDCSFERINVFVAGRYLNAPRTIILHDLIRYRLVFTDLYLPISITMNPNIYTIPAINTTSTTNKMTTGRANKLPLHRRPLFASLTTPMSIMEDEELGIQGYSRVKISRLGRQQRNVRTTLDNYRQSAIPASAVSAASLRATLASAITRKQQKQQLTLAQELMMEDEAAEADELLALVSSKTCATVLSPAPTPVTSAFSPIYPPGLRLPSLPHVPAPNSARGGFPAPLSHPDSSRPSSRSSSVDSFEFDTSDDESLCASSESSFDTQFGTHTSVKPQLSISIPTLYQEPAANAFEKFVPPQVHLNANNNRNVNQPWSHTTSPSISSLSSVSSVSSWRSSYSRASIDSTSSVSSYGSVRSAAAVKPVQAPLQVKAKPDVTKYIYQGGVSTVVSGGVMLGGGKPKPPTVSSAPQLAKYRAPIGGRRSENPAPTTATGSWRRGPAGFRA